MKFKHSYFQLNIHLGIVAFICFSYCQVYGEGKLWTTNLNSLVHVDTIKPNLNQGLTIKDSTPLPSKMFKSISFGLTSGFYSLIGESSQGLEMALKSGKPNLCLSISSPLNSYFRLRLDASYLQLANNNPVIQSLTNMASLGLGMEGGIFLATKKPILAQIYGLVGSRYHVGKVKNSSSLDSSINKSLSFWSIPVGTGIRFYLNHNWFAGIELNYHFTSNDLLDGVERGSNDSYFGVGINISKSFGFKSAKKRNTTSTKGLPIIPIETIVVSDVDGDTVPDSIDRCKNEKGLVYLNGCPDFDLDSVPDIDDWCKEVKGSRSTKGCPDMDSDGLVEQEDPCPNIRGTLKDSDGDGIANDAEKLDCICNPKLSCPCIDQCPDSCDPTKDSDQDGVLNSDDKAPCEKGPICNSGQPLAGIPYNENDYDGDSVLNVSDSCPCEKGFVYDHGCPLLPDGDFDNDEVLNHKDKCPNEKGPACNNGCPNGGDDDCDGLTGKNEKCPKIQGKRVNGKVDSDSDGIPDAEDLCDCQPSTCFCGCPTGCDPDADTDGDKVKNVRDVNICIIDRDNDGVPDNEDNCPYIPGPVSNKGCPK